MFKWFTNLFKPRKHWAEEAFEHLIADYEASLKQINERSEIDLIVYAHLIEQTTRSLH